MLSEKNRPLWAPWRIEFIRSPKTQRCFLCNKRKYIEGDNEEKIIIYRGKYNFVILNRYPYNSGHLMIVPYRHIHDISMLKAKERYELIDIMLQAEEVLKKLLHPDGFNIGFNIGAAAGAGLKEHIHLHIVPRWEGDNNFMPVLSDTRVVPEALEKTAALIKKEWHKL